jgi:hypothetical protein
MHSFESEIAADSNPENEADRQSAAGCDISDSPRLVEALRNDFKSAELLPVPRVLPILPLIPAIPSKDSKFPQMLSPHCPTRAIVGGDLVVQLAVKPDFSLGLRHHRALLPRLEQARRAALAHHVSRIARLGACSDQRVLVGARRGCQQHCYRRIAVMMKLNSWLDCFLFNGTS